MKNLIVILLITVLFGCGRSNNTKVVLNDDNRPLSIKAGPVEFDCFEWEHKGHKYLIINRSHGSGITHAGHCGCGNGINTRTGGDFME
jgi:hypothetical protein